MRSVAYFALYGSNDRSNASTISWQISITTYLLYILFTLLLIYMNNYFGGDFSQ